MDRDQVTKGTVRLHKGQPGYKREQSGYIRHNQVTKGSVTLRKGTVRLQKGTTWLHSQVTKRNVVPFCNVAGYQRDLLKLQWGDINLTINQSINHFIYHTTQDIYK